MIDTKVFFKDFNHSKFAVFLALLPFSVLLSVNLDGYIFWSLWTVFTPIWILKLAVILGAITGTYVWCNHPQYRNQPDGYTDFKAMLITVGLHLLLLMFEVLLCSNIEKDFIYDWVLVFIPLFFVSSVAVIACIWGFRNDRSSEMEVILATNALFFIFIALKLNGTINWTWTAVFIPLWIIMCLPCLAVLYYFIWTVLFISFSFFRTAFPGTDRMAHLTIALTWILVVVPLLTFEVLLCYKLDGLTNRPWVQTFIPLYICLLASLLSSFGGKGGNKWWFGIREDFLVFLLNKFPSLKLYGNNSYKMSKQASIENEQTDEIRNHRHPDYITCNIKNEMVVNEALKLGPVVPVVIIENPD